MSKFNLPNLSGVQTADGKNWLTLALDPYHDKEVAITGFPDGEVSHSYVISQKESVDLKCVTPETNWDAHITIVPEMMYHAACAYSIKENHDTGALEYKSTSNAMTLGNCVISSTDTGGSTWNDTGIGWHPPNVIALPSENANAPLREGAARVVAMAFEVHNTSPPLEKGGSVLTYRMPSGLNRETHYVNDTDVKVTNSTETITESHQPPATIAQASVIPNSKTWEAKDGAMCVATFGAHNNPLVIPTRTKRAFVAQSNALADSQGVLDVAGSYSEIEWVPNAMDIVGAYFTGLPADATLRVSVVRYIEISPLPTSTTISAAIKAPDFDPTALELYFKVKNSLPSGVPVGMNAAGDWWRFIVSAAKKVLPVLANVTDNSFFAGMPIATSMYQTGANMLNKYNKLKKVNKNNQNVVNAQSQKKQSSNSSFISPQKQKSMLISALPKQFSSMSIVSKPQRNSNKKKYLQSLLRAGVL